MSLALQAGLGLRLRRLRVRSGVCSVVDSLRRCPAAVSALPKRVLPSRSLVSGAGPGERPLLSSRGRKELTGMPLLSSVQRPGCLWLGLHS